MNRVACILLHNLSCYGRLLIEMCIAIPHALITEFERKLRYGRDSMEAERITNAAVSLEPYVDSTAAGQFLGLHPVTVMRLAREGHLPGHPVRNAKRRQWRFLLSELSKWLARQTGADTPAEDHDSEPIQFRTPR